MKQNDIKNALNEIRPDPYMKARLEAKVGEATAPKRHRRAFTAGLAATLCVAIVAVSMGVGGFTMKTNPIVPKTTAPTQSASSASIEAPGFVMVAYADENDNIVKKELKVSPLEARQPVKYQLEVKNIMGLSDNEIEKEIKKFSKKVETLDMKNANCGFSSVENIGNALVAQLQLDYFDFDLKEYDNVAKITASCNGNYGDVEIISYDAFYDENGNHIKEEVEIREAAFNKAFSKGARVEFDGKRYIRCRDEKYFFGISWKPSQKLFDAIQENPDLDLTTITDTLTFEVEFNDGAISRSVIDITFDSEGNMFAAPQAFDYIK